MLWVGSFLFLFYITETHEVATSVGYSNRRHTVTVLGKTPLYFVLYDQHGHTL